MKIICISLADVPEYNSMELNFLLRVFPTKLTLKQLLQPLQQGGEHQLFIYIFFFTSRPSQKTKCIASGDANCIYMQYT